MHSLLKNVLNMLILGLISFASPLFAATPSITLCLDNKTDEAFLLGANVNTVPTRRTIVGAGQTCTEINELKDAANYQITFLLTHVKKQTQEINLLFNKTCAEFNFQPYRKASNAISTHKIYMWQSNPIPVSAAKYYFTLEKKDSSTYHLHCIKQQ